MNCKKLSVTGAVGKGFDNHRSEESIVFFQLTGLLQVLNVFREKN